MLIRKLVSSLGDCTEYGTQSVPEDALHAILDSMRLTPSAANLQPWEIVIVSSDEGKQALVACTLDPLLRDDPESKANWILNAPTLMVVCADTKRVKARYGSRGETFAIEDVASAAQTMRMTAIEMGIKSALIREFDPDKVRAALGIPTGILPIALVTLGYSTQETEEPPLFGVEQFVHSERWGQTRR